ncbi:hypothetical protein KP509_10G051300 [Ceratopteris richardii]|uniref:Electron transfer flavoprotein subunit beta n=1 Tax=Ceratopteris richardii TaxID=49495 RepID=A0A8T2U4T0_CERRI|nr:hypothetical protein KP509_10G051300 [Ceratopteris richardii]
MKILVSVKRVIDYAVKIRVKPDKTGVETANVKMSMNPFCEIALEEALRVKESGAASEVVIVSMGNEKCTEVLRTGLAMGADRGIHVATERPLYPLAVAKLLQALVRKEEPGLLLLGKQVKVDKSENCVHVEREIDGGLESLRLQLPAVITTDLRLNQPRYATLPNIMKAKKKPIAKVTPEELQVEITEDFDILEVVEPDKRKAGVMLSSVDELLDKLKNEAHVL